MKISSYVKTLRGVVSKDEVLNSLNVVQQDLNSKVLPILSTAKAAFKVIKIKSPELIAYEARYRSSTHMGRATSVFSDVYDRLQNVARNLDFIREAITKSMPETVAASAIDFRSATLLQLVDNASFLMRYIRRFTETMVILETGSKGIYDNYQKENLNKGEMAWVDNHFPNFVESLIPLSEDPITFKKKFDEIPNVQVDPNGDEGLFGTMKMDPYKLGFIPVFLNPFFIVGKWIADWEHWRYKEAQEDLVRIQKRILLLEEAEAGRSNLKIEKELNILRDKSEGLTYKINKAEEFL